MVAALLTVSFPLSTEAAPFSFDTSGSGNDCAGALGNPPNCSYKDSPMIIKYDFTEGGAISEKTFGVFNSIDGDEFTFTIDLENGESSGTGSWTYTPGIGDPAVTAFSVKGGNGYNVYTGSGTFSNTWSAPDGKGVSHITFFDTDGSLQENPIPVPSTIGLMGIGLLGLGWLSRRKGYRL
jgi:hypothetical protein